MVSVLDLFQGANTKVDFSIANIRWGWLKVYKCIPDAINPESMELVHDVVISPRVFCTFGVEKLNALISPVMQMDAGVVGTSLKICGKLIMFDDSWYSANGQGDIEYHKIPNFMDEMERIGHVFENDV